MDFILQFFGSVTVNTLLTASGFIISSLIAFFFSKSRGGLFLSEPAALLLFAYMVGKIGIVVGLTAGVIIGLLHAGVLVSALIGFSVYIVCFYMFIKEMFSDGNGFYKVAVVGAPAFLTALSCVLTSIIIINPATP